MKTTIKTLRLKNEIIAGVNKIAKQENRNFSNMVETILLERIEMDKL